MFQVAGWYRLDGLGVFAQNTTGIRGTKFTKNGSTTIIGSENVISANVAFVAITPTLAWVQASVGDYVELQVYQNSGAALSTSSNSGMDYITCMRVEWMST